MKRFPMTRRLSGRRSSVRRWTVVSFAILLALSACERPIPRDEGPDTTDVVEPTSVPIVIPTATPTAGFEIDTSGAPGSEGTGETGSEGQPPGDEPISDTPGESSGETTSPSEPERTDTSYTVQAGDTLGQIAQDFGLTIEELAAANNITDIDTLDVGQVLVIPVPGTVEVQPLPSEEGEERIHVVVAGENLFRIGLVYGFTVEELAEYNGIADPSRLEIGQVIRIPPDQP